MKKVIFILSILWQAINGTAQDTVSFNDNGPFKRGFNSIELCGGIAPRPSKNVVSSDVHPLWGLWYQYTAKLNPNMGLGIIANPLLGKETYVLKGVNSYKQVSNKNFMPNIGVSFMYGLSIDRKEKLNRSLIFEIGDLFSPRYLYQSSIAISSSSSNFPENSYDSIERPWIYGNPAFPAFLKISYLLMKEKMGVKLSLSEFIFSHDGDGFSGLHLQRLYSLINIGLVL